MVAGRKNVVLRPGQQAIFSRPYSVAGRKKRGFCGLLSTSSIRQVLAHALVFRELAPNCSFDQLILDLPDRYQDDPLFTLRLSELHLSAVQLIVAHPIVSVDRGQPRAHTQRMPVYLVITLLEDLQLSTSFPRIHFDAPLVNLRVGPFIVPKPVNGLKVSANRAQAARDP
jgi:hypothetical protein